MVQEPGIRPVGAQVMVRVEIDRTLVAGLGAPWVTP